jgi:hypothetical protein
MTGTLGANAVWDWMPFMAGLNGEEGPHDHRNPAHGVESLADPCYDGLSIIGVPGGHRYDYVCPR